MVTQKEEGCSAVFDGPGLRGLPRLDRFFARAHACFMAFQHLLTHAFSVGVQELPCPPLPSPAASDETSSTSGPADGLDHKRGKQLHILHIIKHCGYGNGSVHVAVDLACEQASNKHRVTFISAGGTFEPLLERYGVHHVKLSHEQDKPGELLKATWGLLRFALKEKPDVLHAHMMSSALVAFIASFFTRIPLVTTVHNSFDRHSSIMRLGDRVVAVSKAERQQLAKKGFSEKRLVAIMNAPNRSPREHFMVDEDEFILQSPSIFTACGLHRRKGVADLIEACREVFLDLPDWRLYIAGEGPDRECLEKQAAEANISGRIQFVGYRHSARPLMEQCDIFVLASYADPCSLVIGEARGSGCAIVATDVGGTPEMLDFGRSGRLVKPGDPKELASALRELMLDRDLRLGLRQAALAGSEIFDVARLMNDYDEIYRSAILSPRG